MITTSIIQLIGWPTSGKSFIRSKVTERLESAGYRVCAADLADYHFETYQDGEELKLRASDWEVKDKRWQSAINNAIGSCDFLFVESVSGTDKIYTDAIYRVEADVALIAKRHRERGIPLTNDDLDYYSVLDQIADNTIWKSAPSFVLDGNSLEQSAEIVLENMGLATSSQELTMLGGRPTSVF